MLVLAGVGLLAMGVAVGRADRGSAETAGPSELIGPTVATIAFTAGGQSQMATGVAVDRRGHVLVRASLLAGARQLQAACAGRRPTAAQVVAVDQVDDVALVRMVGSSCRVVPTATRPKVGVEVMAVRADDDGSRLMWRTGSVRTTDQDLTRDDGVVTEVFQTDAAGIGQRGDGVVFTSDGQFVGIVAAAPDDGRVVVLPAPNLVRTAVDLSRGRTVAHPWIGITGHDLADGESTSGRVVGATVTAVTVAGPADLAGMLPGDVVVAIDQTAVTSMTQLARIVHRSEVGQQLAVQIERAGLTLTVALTVGTQPPN